MRGCVLKRKHFERVIRERNSKNERERRGGVRGRGMWERGMGEGCGEGCERGRRGRVEECCVRGMWVRGVRERCGRRGEGRRGGA